MNVLLVIPLNEPYDLIAGRLQQTRGGVMMQAGGARRRHCVYPSGPLSIAAYVRRHLPDCRIQILDLNALLLQYRPPTATEGPDSLQRFLSEARSLVEAFAPDLIGISTLFTSIYRDLPALVDSLRSARPEALVVCGGHLATTVYDRIYDDRLKIDAILFGEGEKPFLELARALGGKRHAEYLRQSPSWITPETCRLKARATLVNDVLADMDEIPPYDLGVLAFPDVYYEASRFLFMPEPMPEEGVREMILFSTRGCPFNCVFCASHPVHGKTVRTYSAARIKSDIALYHERYGITKFTFYDDHFLADKQHALEILDFIRQRGFTAGVINPAFFSVDEEIAGAMARTGVRSVILAIESGNEQTRKRIIGKPSSLARAEKTVEILHRAGINAGGNVIIGLPGETPESIDAGTRYLLGTAYNWFMCFVAAPLPGSRLYESCLKNGYFVPGADIWSMDFRKCIIQTDGFRPDFIEKKIYEINLQLNFVNNYDLRSGNYSQALMMFDKVITSAIDTHAFAHYYAARCCAKLGMTDRYRTYKDRYNDLIARHASWRGFSQQFGLKPLD